jgi:hypothetical protein
MADVERSVYFYKVEMLDDGQQWRRASVLKGLAVLSGEKRMLALGDDAYAWAQVDRIPTGTESGRLRLFRDRRANLPGYALDFVPNELPIPAEAGLIEPTHVVLAANGLIAAEYNHFAPRIPSAFATLLQLRLGLSLRIGTYVQADIIEQLDRLLDIRLLELSMVPTPDLEAELRNAGKFGVAVAELSEPQGGRRVHLSLSGDRNSSSWTEQARAFVKRVLGMGAGVADDGAGVETKGLRVKGFDSVAGDVETVDLLKQKLVRQVKVVRDTERSKVLNMSSAYTTIEAAVTEVLTTDLQHAVAVFS